MVVLAKLKTRLKEMEVLYCVYKSRLTLHRDPILQKATLVPIHTTYQRNQLDALQLNNQLFPIHMNVVISTWSTLCNAGKNINYETT